MANAGYAALQVIPSVRGISEELRRQVVQPAEQAGDQAGEQAGGKFREQFKAGLLAAGAVAGAALAAATVKAVEKERMADRLSAQLGLTGKGAQKAGKVAGDLYSKAVVTSFEEGANTVRAVMSSGLVPEGATVKSIEAISTRVADLALTFDQDLTSTANAAAQMIKTGLAKDGAQALDILARGFQTGANKADDLLDTFNEYGTQFRKLGLDGKTALGLINQMIANGARDSDIAADALKEFSIRAIDMSDSSREAYKALGLSAEQMEKQIGRGGESARKGLDLVIERLRSMKDPVEQEAAAVGLFGTQAEDLGRALYSMDLDTAADGLGKIGGAAKRVGDTIRGNTATELEILKRQLTDALGTVVTVVVLPTIRGLITAVQWVGSAIAATGRWFQKWGAWLIPLGILIGGVTLVVNAQAIAVALVTGVFRAYRAVILAWSAVTRIAIGVQTLWNAVMTANPIGLIIVAIVALVALIVVAYKRSETFRRIVQGAWEGIQTAAKWAWERVLKPAIDGLVAGWRWVADAAVALWARIKPVLGYIMTGLKVLAAVAAVVVFGPMVVGIKVLSVVFPWLWKSVIKPVIGWIVTGFRWWWAGVKVYFNLVKIAFRAVGAVAMWLWKSAIKPVVGWIIAGFRLWWAGVKVYFNFVKAAFRAVGAAATWLWQKAIKPVINLIIAGFRLWWAGVKVYFNFLKAGLRAVGAAFTWLYNKGVKPALDWIKGRIAWVWRNGIKPVFDTLKRGVTAIRDSFKKGVDGIGRIWEGLKKKAKGPVQFVVDTVYNGGIRKVWNTVAGVVGLKDLPTVKFARGGRTRGGVPGKDSIPALMMADEFVIKRDSARRVGFGTLDYINRTGELPVQRFADGGPVEWLKGGARKVGSAITDGWDFLTDPGRMWDKAIGFIRGHIASIGSTRWAKLIAGLPATLLRAMKKRIVGAAEDTFGSGAGGRRPVNAPFGTPFGARGSMWSSGYHTGLDFPAPTGTPVRAIARGLVAFTRNGGPYGQHILLDHGRGLQSLYAHLSAILVGSGVVKAGQVIGRVGSTGNSSGPHLHLEVRRGGRAVDPKPYVTGGYARGGRPRRGEIAWVGEEGPELVRFGGPAEVFDHDTSMRMSAGWLARGFAKGTAGARAKARKEIPGDLSAFLKALKGSASDISKAAAALTADLKAAGGAGRTLATQTGRASAKLQSLATQRDAVAARITAAREAAADQKGTAADYLGLSNLSGATSVTGLIRQMTGRQNTLKAFQGQISTLSKRGLNQDLISQLVPMGPDSGMAKMLAGATQWEIGQLNKLATTGAKLSTSYGNTMADAMFDAGRNASKGFLSGLTSQQKQLQAAMNSLGDSLVKSIRRKLRIKSPSRVTWRLAEQTGEGVEGGLDAMRGRVAAAAARVAAAAVPAPAVAPTPVAVALRGGIAPGQPVLIQLEDGPLVRGWVRGIADESAAAGSRELLDTLTAGRNTLR
ncbi:peptidoglycan DD-metalloendopeptidase family protein [Streptomyces sp. DH37]|uniref:peptidoglycan DD-metalloendopeptidase family protein n=1 Tax=Streptomyces sp. DH37 TaxID=3040122 RepID=UPI00244192BB|nr:peptidoglycan DD-metalloendopeptidase family protein [Streptomyces sp. DH37]MDG9703820.1 peptidoglycan DD-metalloendopeptidase family protein [Streptomyces sp. DH37]